MGSRIMFALDNVSWNDALSKAEQATGNVWGFKLKPELFFERISDMSELKKLGRIMVDPKLFDTPDVTTKMLERMVNAGADIVTVHMTPKYVAPEELRPYIAGVTVLTSMSDLDCQDTYNFSRQTMVEKFSSRAVELGYKYIVCSAVDIPNLPLDAGNLLKLCPAIRPAWSIIDQDDQDDSNKATPRFAIRNSAYLLIVGRPLLKASNLPEALARTNKEVSETINNLPEWAAPYKFND